MSLKPGANDLPFDVYLEKTESEMGPTPMTGVSFYRLKVSPVVFGESIFIDLSATNAGMSPAVQAARNLNSLVSGTAFSNVAARIWSLLPTASFGGDSSSKTLSEGGTFSVSNLYVPVNSLDVPVQVDNGSGVKQKGKVALRSVYPITISFEGVIGSGSSQTIELSKYVPDYFRMPGSTLNWSPVSGALASVEGMSVDAAGNLTLPAPTAAMQGTNTLYLDLLVTPPEIFGAPQVQTFKVAWVVGNFSVLLAADTGTPGGAPSLDLNSFLPSGTAPTGVLQWVLPSNGMGPSSWTVTPNGILSFTGGGMPGMPSSAGALVVQARDESQKLFLGLLNAQVRSPIFTGSLAVSAGGSAALNLGTLSYSSSQETNKWALQRGPGVQLDGIAVSSAGSLSVQASATASNGVYRVYPARTTTYQGMPQGATQIGRVDVTVTGGSSTLLEGVSTVLGSKVVKVLSTTGLTVGTSVNGPGLASDSTVASVDGPSQFTLNLPAVANLVGSTLSGGFVILPPFVPPADIAFSSTVRPVVGASESLTIDLNTLVPPWQVLTGTKVWSAVSGQSLPSWVTVGTLGSLVVKVPAGNGLAGSDVYVQVEDGAQTKLYAKITLSPAEFGGYVFADLSSNTASNQEETVVATLDLNPLVTGTAFTGSAVRNWTLSTEQTASIMGIRLSTSGTFSVTNRAMSSVAPVDVGVEVTTEGGIVSKGKVLVRALYPRFAAEAGIVGVSVE